MGMLLEIDAPKGVWMLELRIETVEYSAGVSDKFAFDRLC